MTLDRYILQSLTTFAIVCHAASRTRAAMVTRFQVKRTLASGASDDVCEAQHLALGHRVAIKILRPGIPETADIRRRRFLREARVWRRGSGVTTWCASSTSSRPSKGPRTPSAARPHIGAIAAAGDEVQHEQGRLRADVPSSVAAPAMTRLADERACESAVSGGNVTQYGWYALLTSRPALYWHLEPSPDDAAGAIPLRIARQRG
jgi:hypothetical protein